MTSNQDKGVRCGSWIALCREIQSVVSDTEKSSLPLLPRHWGQTVSIHPGSWEPKVCQVSAEDSHSGMKGTAQWVPYINLYMSQWAPKGGHPTHNYTSQLWVCAPEFALKCKEAWKTESNMCKAWTGACVCKISL